MASRSLQRSNNLVMIGADDVDGYEIVLAPSVIDVMAGITSKDDARRVRRRLEALAIAPHMGTVYDPIYPSARPPHEVLVTFAGHFGIYYTIDADAHQVCVEYLEDCWRDPEEKFRS